MTEPSAILLAGNAGTLNLNHADAETKAVWAFLARYSNDRTRLNYKADIEAYAHWCRREADLRSMLLAERMHAELYLRYLQRSGYAPATVARRFGTVRMFYKYAMIDEVIAKDPTIAVVTPKIDHDAQRRTWLTTLQFSQLLNYSRRDVHRDDHGVGAGMLGMRIAEMCSLDVTDVKAPRRGRERHIHRERRAAVLPLEVLTAFDSLANGRDVGPLFLTRDTGTRWQPADARLERQGVSP